MSVCYLRGVLGTKKTSLKKVFELEGKGDKLTEQNSIDCSENRPV